MQLYADDLKKSLQQAEKERDLVVERHSTQLEELKRDKRVLGDFLKQKDQQIQALSEKT